MTRVTSSMALLVVAGLLGSTSGAAGWTSTLPQPAGTTHDVSGTRPGWSNVAQRAATNHRSGTSPTRTASAAGNGMRDAASAAINPAVAPLGNWPTYHHEAARSGYDASVPTFSSVIAAWGGASVTVDGDVYAEPLVVGNTVVIATENNSVYALNAATGAQLWHDNLGPPVPSSSLPCGNVPIVGITSTPVIDPVAGIVYVVGLVQPAGQPMNHVLAAINLNTGAIIYQNVISVTGIDPQHHNQRGALALSGGSVYIPFGGRYGDCTPYHGWFVSYPASGGGSPTVFEVSNGTTIHNGGGLWQSGGPSQDSSGNLYVTSGNTFGTTTYDGGETVFKLSAALAVLSRFYPTNWATLNQNDTDLGSSTPIPVGSNLIFQVGKSGDGFLLSQSNVGGIGGQLYTGRVCDLTQDAAFGGPAYVDPYIYVPCADHLVALTLNTATSPPTFSPAWNGPASNATPPIVAAGFVWIIDWNGQFYALDPTTGAVRFNQSLGGADHFATPAAGAGKVFVAAKNHVYAFTGPGIVTPCSPGSMPWWCQPVVNPPSPGSRLPWWRRP